MPGRMSLTFPRSIAADCWTQTSLRDTCAFGAREIGLNTSLQTPYYIPSAAGHYAGT